MNWLKCFQLMQCFLFIFQPISLQDEGQSFNGGPTPKRTQISKIDTWKIHVMQLRYIILTSTHISLEVPYNFAHAPIQSGCQDVNSSTMHDYVRLPRCAPPCREKGARKSQNSLLLQGCRSVLQIPPSSDSKMPTMHQKEMKIDSRAKLLKNSAVPTFP